MGHRRLSIIDLSDRATQPMINKDKNIIISVNGKYIITKKLEKAYLINMNL